ncbi:hypothetical protein B0H11DRAFT_1911737 [Mycena galericulata]|nr:hypothetical protein B0H11DRAFT_1911737 [Mycena galericulata]
MTPNSNLLSHCVLFLVFLSIILSSLHCTPMIKCSVSPGQCVTIANPDRSAILGRSEVPGMPGGPFECRKGPESGVTATIGVGVFGSQEPIKSLDPEVTAKIGVGVFGFTRAHQGPGSGTYRYDRGLQL